MSLAGPAWPWTELNPYAPGLRKRKTAETALSHTTEVLGGRVAFPGDPVNVALANSWIVINGGGGPTDDKPTVILETPRDPDRVSARTGGL